MKNKINYTAIITFYVIAVALRYLTNKTDILSPIDNGILKAILHGIGPAVGAVVVFTVFKIKPVLSLKGNYKKLLTPFLIFWALPIVLILGAEYYTSKTVSFATVTAILIYGLLEEIGWRGFLQQELKSLPPFLNILIVAVLWFAWHLNFEMTSSNIMFFGILVLGSWGIGKVANSTHSLLAVSAFHSLNNFFAEMNSLKIAILITLLSVWVISLIIKKRQSVKTNAELKTVIEN
ncbi:CPBP family intramembrane metalloprotease [Flavobacterium sp. Sd200]|uniref:CPBP family intramembrane glutamic endopeptidase n=1 Tax=Flavobacterium sp. Sd200 TaxID=2692211 RepID=UPI00136909A5|nr:CPBP family intramembrane glutamic endopeptidase [Flavobacterium sp. Sd200]MXN93033.1 CPBP family intramembrane metalloprotease [Flavobacterium sp. Sd200]